MGNNLVLLTIKIVTIILVIFIFYVVVQNNLVTIIRDDFVNYNNKMKYKPANTRIMYYNTGELPWQRHKIQSSIPYDVKVKDEVNNAYYYEYDNKTYNEKLKEVFKSNCEELIIATEGTSWSRWLYAKAVDDPKLSQLLVDYYNKIYAFVYTRLNESSEMKLPSADSPKTIQIVHDILLRYRYHNSEKSYYMFDIEMILYREGKLQGKHIKLVAVCNGKNINIILCRIIGVVSEDQIALHPYVAVDSMNDVDFDVFIPIQDIGPSMGAETKNSTENTFLVQDSYLNSEVETVLYNKLLQEENVEDVDISNNNYMPKKEELVKKNACTL